jgi:dTDP-4-dehydrorhamnose reductase
VGKNILITGATGLLGQSLTGLSRDNLLTGVFIGDYKMTDSAHVRYVNCDVRDPGFRQKVIPEGDLDCVIHTAGIANVDYCETHYNEAFDSNINGTQKMIDLCKATGAKLVYISTNAVFNGKNAPYDEEAPPDPINKYGQIKLACEKLVRDQFAEPVVVRPILMYGWNLPFERANTVTWLIDKLSKKEKVKLVNDVFENPLYSVNAAHAIWEIIQKDLSGTFHLAGGEICHRYDFGLAVAEVFGLEPGLLEPVPNDYFTSIAPRPRNTSFITKKMERTIGVKPMTLREGLKDMKAHMNVRMK